MTARILDPKFKYVPAKHMGPDYLAKRFARIRRQLSTAPQGGKNGEHSSEWLGQPTQKADAPVSGLNKETTALPPAVAAPNVRQLKRRVK